MSSAGWAAPSLLPELGAPARCSLLKLARVHRKWRVISHPLNTNPFPGSFLNYRGRLRLRDVTINNLTLVELEGGFDTEHAVSLWVLPPAIHEVAHWVLSPRAEKSLRCQALAFSRAGRMHMLNWT